MLERFPALTQHRKSFLLAINKSYAASDTVVHDGDEIAVIPPVSGG
jgi:molybdopterin converting factor small subunit